MARVGIMCSAAHSECVGQLVGKTSRSAPSRDRTRADSGNEERPIARVHEHVDPQVRQVDLAIRADHAVRPGQDAGVEQPRTVPLQQAEDAIASRSRAGRDDAGHLIPIDRDGMRQPLFPAGEAVTGEGALREDDQVRPAAGRLGEAFEDAMEVLVQTAQLGIHLDGGHAVGRGWIHGLLGFVFVGWVQPTDRR
jgi:hypothetical protein